MNKYEVIGSVGEGAYGIVLKCRNRETGEFVAIKKFKECEDDECVRKTTLREVKLLRLLRHENIVQLNEAFRKKGRLYLVFEFVDKNLLEWLEVSPGGLEAETVRQLTWQLTRAIDHCHRHDVVHRDIKPENLLVNVRDLSLKLCDFGFARTLPAAAGASLTDYVATRWYRSPELLLGSGAYGKEVDLWAIGCIMGEVADGQPLFPGESEVDQLAVVTRSLGPLTPAQLAEFGSNPRFQGLSLSPGGGGGDSLEGRFLGRMSKRAMGFLRSLLVLDPAHRATAPEALLHPWLHDLRGAPPELEPENCRQTSTPPAVKPVAKLLPPPPAPLARGPRLRAVVAHPAFARPPRSPSHERDAWGSRSTPPPSAPTRWLPAPRAYQGLAELSRFSQEQPAKTHLAAFMTVSSRQFRR